MGFTNDPNKLRYKLLMKKNYANLIAVSVISLLSVVAGCNATAPAKAEVGTALTGQKPNQGTPPAALGLATDQTRGAFGYDFNRDGVTDWVAVLSSPYRGDWYNHTVAVYLSQTGGSYQYVPINTFDPGDRGNGDEPWRVSAKLTDSGDLLITNNNASPFSSSDKQNSYRFRFINGEFVLQEYTHGYSGHSYGKYRVSHLFDLANHTYRKSDTERCDEQPQKPCPSAVTKRLGSVPTMTLQNTAYNKVDMVADLEKFVAK